MVEVNGNAGTSVTGTSIATSKKGVWGDSKNGYGVVGTSDSSYGVYGLSDSSTGVYGISNATGVYGQALDLGVYGQGDTGVYGQGELSGVSGVSDGIGVQGQGDNYGVYGQGKIWSGVYGQSDDGTGVYGQSDDGTGVYGQGGDSDFGVYGESNNAGVYGNSSKNVGVYATGGFMGVVAEAASDIGYGISASGRNIGVYAENTTSIRDYPAAYLGTQSLAGNFIGDIWVQGNIKKFGGGFQIDDPRDPANKFLSHSFVESSDMKNIYDGVAVLESDGKAEIELPDWFGEINGDFRYQLTAIGNVGPNLYIEEEISENKFKIAGGSSGMKVSWQVTGIRKDPWANSNRIKVEQRKSSKERGYYLAPELFNESSDKNIRWARYPDQKQRLQKIKDMNKVKMERLKDMKKKAMKVKMKKGK